MLPKCCRKVRSAVFLPQPSASEGAENVDVVLPQNRDGSCQTAVSDNAWSIDQQSHNKQSFPIPLRSPQFNPSILPIQSLTSSTQRKATLSRFGNPHPRQAEQFVAGAPASPYSIPTGHQFPEPHNRECETRLPTLAILDGASRSKFPHEVNPTSKT
jgi:hypothetical protein